MIQEVQRYTKTVFEPENKNNESIWVTIGEKKATNLILNTCGDEHKHNILNAVFRQPMTISEILCSCKISNTSGYRKINSLIQSGLLIRNGFVTINGKKVGIYKSLFESIQIGIEKDKVIVKAYLSPKRMEIKHQMGN